MSLKIPFSSRRRQGIAGIIGAVILFTLLFTIGTEYFIFVNNANNLETQSLVNRGNTLASRLQENMIVTTTLSLASSTVNHILFFINNTGGQLENLTAVIVLSPQSAVSACFGIALPSGYGCTASPSTASSLSSGDTGTATFPLTANAGRGLPVSGYIDTGITWSTGTYTLKVITAQGNIFSGTYPNTAVPVATLAVTTQGAGLLGINFDTFRAYNVTGTAPGCNPSLAGCQLASWPSGVGGYTLHSLTTQGASAKYYVFAADITNVDPKKRTIVLDSNTVFVSFQVPSGGSGGGTSRAWPWYVGMVNSAGVTTAWSSITINPQQTVTVYFTVIPSTAIGGQSWPGPGLMANFIYFHGTVAGSQYGQNIPFVTTLYN